MGRPLGRSEGEALGGTEIVGALVFSGVGDSLGLCDTAFGAPVEGCNVGLGLGRGVMGALTVGMKLTDGGSVGSSKRLAAAVALGK